ncbi:hypothetical protein HZ326_20074 [Fusarium oxysporum f. sp. albedinis]|nr:hypothetical protein HZ326_20074 [Fusarium oxysporum f. sp. albedinis]
MSISHPLIETPLLQQQEAASSRSKDCDVGFLSSTSLSTSDPGPSYAFGTTSGNGPPVEIFSLALQSHRSSWSYEL